jgi:hypothetical protein
MKRSRREILTMALRAAVLTATPASILAASKRALAASDRYLWLELKGGRFLVLDTRQRDKAFILGVTSPLSDGEYGLRRVGPTASGGKLVVRGGRVVPAYTSGAEPTRPAPGPARPTPRPALPARSP